MVLKIVLFLTVVHSIGNAIRILIPDGKGGNTEYCIPATVEKKINPDKSTKTLKSSPDKSPSKGSRLVEIKENGKSRFVRVAKGETLRVVISNSNKNVSSNVSS
jgi:hypothetical protein